MCIRDSRQVASLADQATSLDEVTARFHVQPSQIVADFGESRSAKLSHARAEFQKMVEMIERGDANAILTWHPDRLSRNLGDVDTSVSYTHLDVYKRQVTSHGVLGTGGTRSVGSRTAGWGAHGHQSAEPFKAPLLHASFIPRLLNMLGTQKKAGALGSGFRLRRVEISESACGAVRRPRRGYQNRIA